MMDKLKTAVRLSVILMAACGLLFLLLIGLTQAETTQNNLDEFGYGFNVDAWDVGKLQGMGFNWMKVFDPPNGQQPVNILIRVEANVNQYHNLSAFGDAMTQLAQSQKGYIDAYEIGNEPNLDAAYGWTVAPNAAHYTAVLCKAYTSIKAVDPNAIVVSAGLAPTGRVAGFWGGHLGHNGYFQDEREFFKEFLAAGGGNCLDAVGYHPFGFSADFDAEPDIWSADPTQKCENGFCFRGVEKLYEIMVAQGYGDKKVWGTEFGWLVKPPAQCMNDAGWIDRQWQIVTEEKQAENLVGAMTYATENWPWMEALFIFNLNFNYRGDLPECEQMRFYAVQDRPAEAALRDLLYEPPPTPTPEPTPSPTPVPKVGKLTAHGSQMSVVLLPEEQPIEVQSPVYVRNVGTAPFTFTLSADSSAAVVPTILTTTAVLNPGEVITSHITYGSNGRSTGTYTGTLTITTTEFVENAPLDLPVSVFIFDTIHNSYLPITKKSD